MASTVGLDKSTHLSNFQPEGCIFEGFLHVSAIEEAQISSLLAAGTLRETCGKFFEEFRLSLELLDEGLDE
jgi:hypothetical protein